MAVPSLPSLPFFGNTGLLKLAGQPYGRKARIQRNGWKIPSAPVTPRNRFRRAATPAQPRRVQPTKPPASNLSSVAKQQPLQPKLPQLPAPVSTPPAPSSNLGPARPQTTVHRPSISPGNQPVSRPNTYNSTASSTAPQQIQSPNLAAPTNLAPKSAPSNYPAWAQNPAPRPAVAQKPSPSPAVSQKPTPSQYPAWAQKPAPRPAVAQKPTPRPVTTQSATPNNYPSWVPSATPRPAVAQKPTSPNLSGPRITPELLARSNSPDGRAELSRRRQDDIFTNMQKAQVERILAKPELFEDTPRNYTPEVAALFESYRQGNPWWQQQATPAEKARLNSMPAIAQMSRHRDRRDPRTGQAIPDGRLHRDYSTRTPGQLDAADLNHDMYLDPNMDLYDNPAMARRLMHYYDRLGYQGRPMEKANSVEEMADILADTLLQHEKQADLPPSIQAIKDWAQQNPSKAIAAAGAGGGGLLGLLSAAGKEEDERDYLQSALTGALGGGLLGTGAGILYDRLPAARENMTEANNPNKYNADRPTTPEREQSVNDARRLLDEAEQQGGGHIARVMGWLKTQPKDFQQQVLQMGRDTAKKVPEKTPGKITGPDDPVDYRYTYSTEPGALYADTKQKLQGQPLPAFDPQATAKQMAPAKDRSGITGAFANLVDRAGKYVNLGPSVTNDVGLGALGKNQGPAVAKKTIDSSNYIQDLSQRNSDQAAAKAKGLLEQYRDNTDESLKFMDLEGAWKANPELMKNWLFAEGLGLAGKESIRGALTRKALKTGPEHFLAGLPEAAKSVNETLAKNRGDLKADLGDARSLVDPKRFAEKTQVTIDDVNMANKKLKDVTNQLMRHQRHVNQMSYIPGKMSPQQSAQLETFKQNIKTLTEEQKALKAAIPKLEQAHAYYYANVKPLQSRAKRLSVLTDEAAFSLDQLKRNRDLMYRHQVELPTTRLGRLRNWLKPAPAGPASPGLTQMPQSEIKQISRLGKQLNITDAQRAATPMNTTADAYHAPASFREGYSARGGFGGTPGAKPGARGLTGMLFRGGRAGNLARFGLRAGLLPVAIGALATNEKQIDYKNLPKQVTHGNPFPQPSTP